MNTDKAFQIALEHHNNGEEVYIVAYYDEMKIIANNLLTLPQTFIENFELTDPLWDGYCDTFTLSLSASGEIYCEKSMFDNGQVGACEGYIIVDEYVENPERFAVSGESMIRII